MDGWMDGWMDGEDLIICVARLVVQKLCGPLTSDDFRVSCIASRNKLRSTSLLGSIWKDFGRFLEAKIEAKINFWEVFFQCFFQVRFGIDF